MNSGRAEDIGNVTLLQQGLNTGEAVSEDELCQSTVVYYNATMRGGINAGVIKDQGNVPNMRKCVEQCCRWQFCSVAFMLLTRCYTVACYNDHLCDTVPAKNLTFTPKVAFISRVRRDRGNFSIILEKISTPSPSLSSMNRTRLSSSKPGINSSVDKVTNSLSPSISINTAVNLERSFEIKPSPSQSLFSKVFTLHSESRHNCTNSEQRYNVTLRGGLNAGHFRDNGKVVSIQQCVEFCCKEDHCDVAFLLLENCFTVRCHNQYLCESVPAKTAKYRSRIVYLGRLNGKTTKTMSLLDAALPAMGGGNETKPSQITTKSTFSNLTGGFDPKQLAQLLSPSPSAANKKEAPKSSILELGDWNSVASSLKENKPLRVVNHSVNSLVSHNQHYITPSILTLPIYNTKLISSPMLSANSSSSTHTEPNKSSTVEGVMSKFSSGLGKTIEDLSQLSIPQPSACLKSPISYNVTLRNGIRSGYFRDQGRVENMDECIRKCCDSDTCDVAFMLKQRCYLVTCYTKKGCQTVQARHSLFRPRVAHVQRTNVTQLMSFMDEQEIVEQPRSIANAHHVTPSSTLPAPVKSLSYSSKHSIKTKKSKKGNNNKNRTPPRHTIGKHHKLKLATQHKNKHVTVTPELKKRKARKPAKYHHGRMEDIEPRYSKPLLSKASRMHRFKNKLEKNKNKQLSHTDLEQLFRFMKPRNTPVMPGTIPSVNKPSSAATKTFNSTSRKNSSTDLPTIDPKLHEKDHMLASSAVVNQQTLLTTKENHSAHKSQNTRVDKNRFEAEVERLFEKNGDIEKLPSWNGNESTTTASLQRKEKAKSKVRVTKTSKSEPVKSQLHHGHVFLITKSTVPSLPTLAPDTEASNCSTSQVEYNQTLRGGLSSGLFHEVGKVNDIKSCSQHCCLSQICDLAFMVMDHCFLVTCSSSNPRMCDSTPALATNFNPMISRVSRSGEEDTIEETVEIPNVKPSPTVKPMTSPSELSPQQAKLSTAVVGKNFSGSTSVSPAGMPTVAIQTTKRPTISENVGLQMTETPVVQQKLPPACISSVTEHNVTLRGGLHAGKFTDAGKVYGSPTCTELCCYANHCDVAFYAFSRCFLVHCFDEYLCGSTPSLLPNFNPTVVHVYRHHSKPTPKPVTTIPPINAVLNAIDKETQTKTKPGVTKNKTCAHSDVYDEVTLRMGYAAGNFSSRGKVNSTNQCVEFCCEQRGCDLIFMFLNNCYTVSCISGFACEIVPARQSRFQPKVVYFIKTNSSSLIKPSDFNSSLSGVDNAVKQPVNVVHFKEVPPKKKNENSYKKGLIKLNNITQNVDEEFVLIPDNKITTRSVIKSSGNNTLGISRHVAGSYSSRETKQHKLTPEGSKIKSHIKSPEDEKIDILTKELFNITEENRQLETEVHSIMAKQGISRARAETSFSGKVEDAFKKSEHAPAIRKILKGKIVSNKVTETKSGIAYNDGGSAIDSNASKRVVLVDTDRPPVYPPTDEHNIEEHSIQRVPERIKKRKHRVNSARKVLAKQRSPQMQHSASKDKRKYSNRTNKHAVEERINFNAGSASGHPKALNKHPSVGVHEGSENKYGQPEPDEDSLELGEIMNQKLNSKIRKKPEKPVWISSESKNEDDIGIHYENKSQDIFQFEKHLEPEKPKNKVWSGIRNKSKDNTDSFLEQTDEKKPRDQHDIQIEKEYEPRKSNEQLTIRLHNRSEDRLERFHDQIEQTHRSPTQSDDKRGSEKLDKDGFRIKTENKQKDPVKIHRLASGVKRREQMNGFYQRIRPTYQAGFQIDKQTENMNAREDGSMLEHQLHQKKPQEKTLISLKAKNNDHMESFHERISPTSRPHFQLNAQKRKQFEREDKILVKSQDNAEMPERKVWSPSGDQNKDPVKSFHEQIAPDHSERFEFEKQRQRNDVNQDEFHSNDEHHQLSGESSGSKVQRIYAKEDRKGTQDTAKGGMKRPEPRFAMSNTESVLSDFAELEANLGKSHLQHKGFDIDSAYRHKWLSKDNDKIPTRVNDIKERQQMDVVETLKDISPNSANYYERVSSPGRKQNKPRRRKPDLDAIYDKINVIYNRLQDVIEQHAFQRNVTAGQNAESKYSRRHEDDIPRLPNTSVVKPTSAMSSGKPTRKKITVLKQYVTDKIEGSGAPSNLHVENLMEYIKNIYSRVQEIYKRGTKQSAFKGRSAHRKKRVHRVFSSGDWKKGRKYGRERSRSRVAKKHHRKKNEEKSILREMKQIYKSMKKLYRQQKKAQKKSEAMDSAAERQYLRSFIPGSFSKTRTEPSGLGSMLEKVRPLNSSTAVAQNKPQVHIAGMYPSYFF